MTINFNFKKYFKYFMLFLLAYILLHSFTNVKAYSNLDSQYIVNYTNEDDEDISEFTLSGTFDDLLATGMIDINVFNTYYNSMKSAIITKLNYSSWQDFVDNNYYINDLWLSFGSNNSITLDFSFYYISKSSAYADKFNLAVSTTIRSSSTPTINANQTYYTYFNVIYRSNSFRFNAKASTLSNGVGQENGPAYNNNWTYGTFANRYLTCSTNSTNCVVTGYDSSSKTLTLDFRNTNNYFTHYVDTNKETLDLYFSWVSATLSSSDYLFQKATKNNGSTIYNLITPISTNILDRYSVGETIVKEFNDGSFGLDFGTIDNGVYSQDETNFTDSSVMCPFQESYSGKSKDFVNNICYIDNTDFTTYDTNFTNFYNSTIFMFPESNDIVSIDTHKFYILTIRTYSNYPLKINSLFFNLFNYDALLPATIENVVFHDFTFYYDYQIIFYFDSAFSDLDVSGYIDDIIVNFDSMNNYVTILPDVYSFGISKVVKLNVFPIMPSSTSINNDYLNNSLSNISNSLNGSFFTNFKVNDYGLSSIVLLPINYIRSLRDSVCSPISLPLPHLSNFTLPCVSSFMSSNFNSIWVIFKLIINGLLIYRACIDLYGIVKNIYKPDNDRIEVVDL